MQGKSAPPRPEYRVADAQGNKIGVVTSGTMSPSLETGLGMALIQTSMAHPGTTLQIEIRNRWFPAQVCRNRCIERLDPELKPQHLADK